MRVAALLALAVLLGACGAARIEGGVFYSPKGYAVTLPGHGWRVAPRGEADLELRRDAPPGGMLADATCEGGERGRPLAVLARHLTFGLTQRVTLENDTRTLGGRPAAHSVVRGVLDGGLVEVEAIVLKGGRCVHDFLYVAPAGELEAGRRDFWALVESLSEAAR